MTPIDVLPDDVLLVIFDFYVVRKKDDIEAWQLLVHVCRRWRCLVFGSPRRLNLQLLCTPEIPARDKLDVWPALPLIVGGDLGLSSGMDNIIAALGQSNRVSEVFLSHLASWQLEKVLAVMQVPFPELTDLQLFLDDEVIPDSFLGGSAPRLRSFKSHGIPFPGLPKLLLTATHLVNLYLHYIPDSGYISPEAMVTCLTMLTSLETFQLTFESPQSCPDQENRRSPPPTRSILPALTMIWFKGVNEYLEDLLAQIDTPRLHHLSAIFFNDIDFDTPELIRFVSRSSIFKAPIEAHVSFNSRNVHVQLQPQASYVDYFEVKILCREPDWQLSSLAQICTTFLPLLSTTENLFIYERVDSQLNWENGIENIEWFGLLLPFTSVKNLYLLKQFAPHIAPALQEIAGGGTTEVLSTLQNIYLEGFQPSEPVEEGIAQFVSARQLTNHPVAIFVWDAELVRDESEEEFDD